MDQHRSEFDKLIEMRIDLNDRIVTLEHTLSDMKNKYKSFTKDNYKKIYLYSLDSFFFQYKILQVEHEHYKRFLALINNRMYGDYYKLYVIIGAQCKESNLRVGISIDDVLVYKDLEPTFDYTIEDIKFIFGKIMGIMEQLNELYKSNNDVILSNNSNNGVGFSIAAFFTTLKYENIILNEQIRMYLDFIKFYQSSQMGHFSKALTDITRFSDEINGKILVNYQVEMEALVKPVQVQEPVKEPEPVIVQVQEPESVVVQVQEPEPVQEPVQEPVVVQVQEPEPVVVQVQEPEPVVVQVQEPESVVVQEPEPFVVQAEESVQAQVQEPVQAQEPEPEPVPVVVQVQEPVVVQVQVQEPNIEQFQEPIIEQVQEPAIEQVQEPANEQVQEAKTKPKNNTPKSRGRPKMSLG